MKYLKYLFLILLIGCNNKKIKSNTSTLIKITDVKEKKDSLSNYFSVINTIKLSVKKREIIASVDKIQISESHIFILNRYSTPGVFVFDMKGDFFKKLEHPFDDNQNFYDFFINKKDNVVEVLIAGKILIYDITSLKYIKSKILSNSAVRFYKKNKLYYFVNGGGENLLTITDDKFKEQIRYFNNLPLNRKKPFSSFSLINNNLMFFKNHSNIIYEANNANIKEKYQFVFNDEIIDNELLLKVKKFREEKGNPFFYKKILKEFFNPLQNYFYFCYIHKGKEYAVIYDRNTTKFNVFDVLNVNNNTTNEKYFPFIIGSHKENFIAVKNLENDNYSKVEFDYEIYFIKPKTILN